MGEVWRGSPLGQAREQLCLWSSSRTVLKDTAACSPLEREETKSSKILGKTGISEIRYDPVGLWDLKPNSSLGEASCTEKWVQQAAVLSLVPWQLGYVQHAALALPPPGQQGSGGCVWACCEGTALGTKGGVGGG